MTRSNARELAVHLIYECSFNGDDIPNIIAARMDKEYYSLLANDNPVYTDRPSRSQQAYIDTVVTGVTNRIDELNAIIQRYSIAWDVNRISKLTRSIMQLAIFEIMNIADVPTGVAISEAVRIAKMYDSDDTGSFVNGILGSFARSLTSEAHE